MGPGILVAEHEVWMQHACRCQLYENTAICNQQVNRWLGWDFKLENVDLSRIRGFSTI